MESDTLGGRLRHLRDSRELSLRKAAQLIEQVTFSHLCDLERDKIRYPRFDTLTALAEFYGVTVKWLLGERLHDCEYLRGYDDGYSAGHEEGVASGRRIYAP